MLQHLSSPHTGTEESGRLNGEDGSKDFSTITQEERRNLQI